MYPNGFYGCSVALRKESVDRNLSRYIVSLPLEKVALRKESVDRNKSLAAVFSSVYVALRKESVDRNLFPLC